jgi:hypothetical protein
MEARLISFFANKKWPDARLRVSCTAQSSEDDGTADSCSSNDSVRELRLPAHRILLANSEFFEAQVRPASKLHCLVLPPSTC